MMVCFKCGKEIDREDNRSTLKGVEVIVTIGEGKTQEDIDYNNIQLGKYSDGNGECHVEICYECYVDTLFGNRRY